MSRWRQERLRLESEDEVREALVPRETAIFMDPDEEYQERVEALQTVLDDPKQEGMKPEFLR